MSPLTIQDIYLLLSYSKKDYGTGRWPSIPIPILGRILPGMWGCLANHLLAQPCYKKKILISHLQHHRQELFIQKWIHPSIYPPQHHHPFPPAFLISRCVLSLFFLLGSFQPPPSGIPLFFFSFLSSRWKLSIVLWCITAIHTHLHPINHLFDFIQKNQWLTIVPLFCLFFFSFAKNH